jgi:DNA-binding LytR/AlgR family response regulator
MPGLARRQVATTLCRREPAPLIVFLTGYSERTAAVCGQEVVATVSLMPDRPGSGGG